MGAGHDPRVSALLQRRHSDEYALPPPAPRERRALARARSAYADARTRASGAHWAAGRRGTAAALRAIDAEAGGGFYEVPAEAEHDPAAADAALGGEEVVIDVQTHYVAAGRAHLSGADGVLAFIRSVAPERFRGLDRETGLSFAEYLRCVYVESETAAAVLTAAPGEEDRNILPNGEIAGTRALLEQLGRGERMRHHAIVHPDDARERDRLGDTLARWAPAGLKVYTLYAAGNGAARPDRRGWRLDDERVGLPFLERARALGVRRVCAHKGLSALAPTGSPADVGPAAAAFPEIDFLVYHSGYEIPASERDEERAYAPGAGARGEPRGTDRLTASLEAARIAPGANVYAELGSTWYALARRPLEAAHVIGKLLRAVGEDRVLWGTDTVWYGPAQPLIDAFRAFRIPERLCEAHGYPPLTRARKAKILGRNAASVYGIDLERARRAAREDDLAWVRDAVAEERRRGRLRP